MTLRTGTQFLDSLRDDREVWLGGERVEVTADPRLAPAARAIADARDLLAVADPVYATRVEAYFEHCREHDLCLTHGFTDPQRDRAQPADAFEPLHVVEHRPDGIVIRGAKAVATLAPFANDYFGLT